MSFFNPSSFAISDPLVPTLPPKAAILPAGEKIRLADRQHARIADGKGLRLEVIAGAVWITQRDVVDDVVLTAGEAAEFADPDGVVVSAIGGAAQFRTRALARAMAV